MRILIFILSILILVLGLTFSALNADPVLLNYYFGTTKIALSLALAFAFAGGLVFGLFAGFLMYLKALRENFRLTHRLKLVEKEVANLRMLPLKHDV